jgi:hypothetical protein
MQTNLSMGEAPAFLGTVTDKGRRASFVDASRRATCARERIMVEKTAVVHVRRCNDQSGVLESVLAILKTQSDYQAPD